MRRFQLVSPLALLLLLLPAVLPAQPALVQEVPAADEAKDAAAEIPLDFKQRESRAARSLSSIDKPVNRLPSDLQPEQESRPSREEPPLPPAPAEESSEQGQAGGMEAATKESRRGGGHGGGSRPRPSYDLYEEASRAAEWAAEWQVEYKGLPEFYRAGVWSGLHDAFERASRRSSTFDEGAADGERDPRAERAGGQEAEKAARARGRQEARAAVEAEFRDLSREPRRNPRVPDEPLPAGLVRVGEPRAEDAFEDVPLGSYLSFPHFDRYVDALQLYRAPNWRAVFDDGWDGDRRAFDHWRDHGDDSLWDRLSRPEQDYFRRTFSDQLDYWRARKLRSGADDAWREGYDDGWDYGADVGAELAYRQGYHQGFLDTATAVAEDVWADLYPRTFEQTYREEYQGWASSARPEIESARLLDANDDGIFEPGEELRLQLEVANFGGAAARLPLLAEGEAIERAAGARPLEMRRRERARTELRLRIGREVAPRTRATILVSAGDAEKETPLYVSRPLELGGPATYGELSSLRGSAAIEATVWNRSTKPVSGGRLDAWVGERSIAGPPLRALGPQESRRVPLEVDGLDGLAMLEGFAEIRLELHGPDLKQSQLLQDQLVQRLPALGLDLESRELEDFWLEAVYGEIAPSRAETVRLVELWARRMEADWEIQRKASGNPYKDDLQGGGRTALGELVSAALAERRPARRPELQEALAKRLKTQADKLPGTHPFLRASFKKLAGKLK
jgi:hypothetical protein